LGGRGSTSQHTKMLVCEKAKSTLFSRCLGALSAIFSWRGLTYVYVCIL
jgi:hypothetical protein